MVLGLFKSKKQKKDELAIKKYDRAASSRRTQGGGLIRKKAAEKALAARGLKSTAQKEKEAKKATRDQDRLTRATARSKQGGRTGAAAQKTVKRLTDAGVKSKEEKKKKKRRPGMMGKRGISRFADTSKWD